MTRASGDVQRLKVGGGGADREVEGKAALNRRRARLL